MGRVLIVEDDLAVGQVLLRQVRWGGHDGLVFNSLSDGLAAAADYLPDVVCLDVNLPDGNGLDSIPSFAESPGRPEVLVLTGRASAADAEKAIRGGAWDYLCKSDEYKGFSDSLHRALAYHSIQEQAAPRNLDLGRMIGCSPAMKACHERLAEASACDAKVLVTGESGTGKELAAWAIHSNSDRRDKSFVVVDCAALPPELVESMLFGHRRGSFTGATESRVGLVEQADGGTLFLDEVAELPMAVQKAFLRMLQEKKFRPVGSDREVSSDFRLVAATNRDLDQMASDGTFRADLLFRLRALTVHLPPLHERGDDVREISLDAVARICERQGVRTKELSPEFIRALSLYSWPGNVRELLNAIEQAVAKAWGHDTLQPVHLPTALRATVAKASFVETHAAPAPAEDETRTAVSLPSLEEHRNKVTRRYLEELLRATRSDVNLACGISMLSRSRFYALLKEHGLARQ